MARPGKRAKGKKTEQGQPWSRREFIDTGLKFITVGTSVYAASKSGCVIVQAPPPAQSFDLFAGPGTYTIQQTPVTMRATTAIVGQWWEDPHTSLFQARHKSVAV